MLRWRTGRNLLLLIDFGVLRVFTGSQITHYIYVRTYSSCLAICRSCAAYSVQQRNLGTLLHRRQIHAISDHSTWNTCMRLYVSCGETTGSTHNYAPHCSRRMWQPAYAFRYVYQIYPTIRHQYHHGYLGWSLLIIFCLSGIYSAGAVGHTAEIWCEFFFLFF